MNHHFVLQMGMPVKCAHTHIHAAVEQAWHLATPCHTSMHLFDGDIGGNEHHQRFLRGLHTVLSDTWIFTLGAADIDGHASQMHAHTHTLRTTTMQCNATQCKLSVRHLMTAGSWSRSVRHLMTAVRYTYGRIFKGMQVKCAHTHAHISSSTLVK